MNASWSIPLKLHARSVDAVIMVLADAWNMTREVMPFGRGLEQLTQWNPPTPQRYR
jgi:hypothetical protein